MRKVTFGGACSLDNFFARKDDSVDWLMWTDEVNEIMESYWATIHTVVMGRRTYEVALRTAGGDGSYPGVTFIRSSLAPAFRCSTTCRGSSTWSW